VPVPGEVAVDGSPPDGVGVAWLPRTPVGDGDLPGEDDGPEGEVPGADGAPDGGTVLDAVAVVPVCAAVRSGEGDVAWDVDAAAEGDALSDAVSPVAVGVVVVWPPDGPTATGRGWAASTATPSTRSPATATIGTTAIPRRSGRSSRQFGQKPETGVAT
jgi:hypothetical protein